MRHHVRPARSSDLAPAAGVLAEAFAEHAWTRWVLPADGYAERLEEMQRLYLTHALAHGLVLVDEQVRAVAAFLPPDAPEPAAPIRQRLAELYGSRLTALAELALPDAPAGSWALETVGVRPAHQGTGLGTAVTSEGLSMIDERGEAVALRTSDERNVRLYERLGFTIVATTEIPDGPIVYSMVRAAVPR
ncbi:GNAT family N-acetyltransferase [Spongiactinospora rosea]|uniref:GNAT family N-acetyltransferase n=1 Tax=Spongiactinospora rosea TaxID=2248750 RepID=A0A366LXA9_9ACTN|nr:GNAT family N-acetyltransferase [Spongiactinospora rosea]RBQ18598.1 GNAT family N-acetyltransferase [Spongiactinospora rosea]